MDSVFYANPDCVRCNGRGRVKTGQHLSDVAICWCAIAGKRGADAERIIHDRFPGRAGQMTLANFQTGDDPKNEQALTVARNFVDNYEQASREGWVLGFWGLPSTGKTHLAVALAQECVRRYLAKPMFFNVPKELRAERERFSRNSRSSSSAAEGTLLQSPIDRAMQAELLVLDDLGAEYHRQGADSGEVSWVYEQLYAILDARIMDTRPTVFTSNNSPSVMERRLGNEAGSRVLSRIERAEVAPALEVIAVPGANRQSEAAADKLFAVRAAKEFELHNKRSDQRKCYDRSGLLEVVRKFREKHSLETTHTILAVTRVERDGKPLREPVPLDKVLKQVEALPSASTLAQSA